MDQPQRGPDPGDRRSADLLLVNALGAALLLCLLVYALLSCDWLAAAAVIGCAAIGLAGNVIVSRRIRREADRRLIELRRHQALVEAIVGTAADAILTCGEDGNIQTANHAAARLFGRPREDLATLHLSVLIPHTAYSDVNTNESRMFGMSAALHGRHRDGRTFPVKVGVSKVRFGPEAVYTVIIHDLSDLHCAREEAEAAGRGKAAFLNRVSHELRTPLNAVLGTAELLRGTPLAADQQQLVELLVESGETLMDCVEQVMDYGWMETGQLRLESRPFALRAVLLELVAPLAACAAAKGLLFSHSIDPGVPDQFIGDPVRLCQILACLIDNAIKFTAAGEVAVVVGPQPADASGQVLVFSVRDTGVGIAAQDQQRIFRPFEQGDSSSTRRAGGIGLGLSLAAGLTRLMGGRISVESAPGAGSTFRVQVVLRPVDRGAGRPGRPVLLALSDAAERAAYAEEMRGMGLEPVGVPTGKEALAEVLRGMIQGDPFRVVVLDLTLPDYHADDWVRKLNGCSAWRGAVVLLHDGPRDPARCPAGVAALIDRSRAPQHLGPTVRQLVADTAGPASGPTSQWQGPPAAG
jgi:two-component system sensor histidine kinase/response regulator